MKKVAVLIYNKFCNFEISVALEMLAMAEKPFVVISESLEPVRSEEGIKVIADKTINDIDINEFDSLILPGASDIREAVENDKILQFIDSFYKENKIIGAISIAPVLLLKIGALKNKSFMAGVNKEELLEEGFSLEELNKMVDWDENIKNPIKEGYIQTDNIITSVSYNFVEWAIAFGKAIGIEVYPKSFGVNRI